MDTAEQPHVIVSANDREGVVLHAGDIVGRVPSAALLLDDPRVSEAHAMLTMRRGRFVLLSLRRLLEVDGKPVRDVELRAGQRVGLSDDTALRVDSIFMPRRALAVEARGLGTRRLGPVASLAGGKPPAVWARFEPRADAHVWSLAGTWRMRVGDGSVTTVATGDEVELSGTRFRFIEIDTAAAGIRSTQGAGGRLAPFRLVTFFDGIEIHREAHPVMTLGGIGARIVSELAAFGGPIPWNIVAREVWPDHAGSPERDLRHRWDAAVSRLRRKLDDAGVRSDLVQADRNGCFQLVLHAGDELEDRS